MTLQITLEGRAASDQTLTYINLPFDVPPAANRLHVAYDYSDAIGSDPQLTGGNTIDIGIFDPRGAAFMAQGFRGWSGSARREFFIAHDDATPGYMPGMIQAGTWWICLGLYKVAPQGCDYKVSIQIDVSDQHSSTFPMLLPLRDHGAPPRPANWYKGDLHCHSLHSDGDSDPADIVALAESSGFDFLAVTDHNNITQMAALNNLQTPLMLIPGYEVTTYHGHWNVWGGKDWIDFRVQTADMMAQSIQTARENGYLVSCNHPRPYGPPWEYEQLEGYHCIEVWNGPWRIMNQVALDFWEARLRTGQRLTAVGGSDCHFLKREHIAQLGSPTIYIYNPGDPSPASLLAGLRAGHAFITEAPDGPQLYLRSGHAMMGDTLEYNPSIDIQIEVINGEGLTLEIWGSHGMICEVPVDKSYWHHSLSIAEHTSYIRAQLRQPSGDLSALTNPIYIEAAQK